MNKSDYATFASKLLAMADALNVELRERTPEAMFETLKDVPLPLILHAFDKLALEWNYPRVPPPAEFLKAAGYETPDMAWQRIMKLAKKDGYNAIEHFTPIDKETLEKIGGWKTYRMNQDNQKYMDKFAADFVKSHPGLSAMVMSEQALALTDKTATKQIEQTTHVPVSLFEASPEASSWERGELI